MVSRFLGSEVMSMSIVAYNYGVKKKKILNQIIVFCRIRSRDILQKNAINVSVRYSENIKQY